MRLLALCLLATALAGADIVYEGYTGYWVSAVATAYSPEDAIDHHYRESKGSRWRYITADARTDVRSVPYGVAVPHVGGKPVIPYGTQVIIPTGHGYLDESRPRQRIFAVDDTGSGISNAARRTGKMHVDLRYIHTEWALKWRTKTIRMFVITGIAPSTNATLESLRADPFYDPAWDR